MTRYSYTIQSSDREDGSDQIKRAAAADEAFSLIWDIDQKLRGRNKYEETTDKEYDFNDEVREMIIESGLMNLYN